METRNLRMPEVVQEQLSLFGSKFERTRKPAAESAIQKRIADEKHEDDREKRDGHCPENHFRFETRAELLFAALGPEAEHGAHEDEAENEKSCGDETGDGVEGESVAPIFGFEGNV